MEATINKSTLKMVLHLKEGQPGSVDVDRYKSKLLGFDSGYISHLASPNPLTSARALGENYIGIILGTGCVAAPDADSA